MPSQVPFVVPIKETVANGGTVEHSYKAPNGQDFLIREMFFVIAAAFSIIRIQSDDGRYYSYASQNDPIPSTELRQSNTDVHSLMLPAIPLLLKGGSTLTIEILDTGGGGANIIILNGELTIP
jgi:hypothetical protein